VFWKGNWLLQERSTSSTPSKRSFRMGTLAPRISSTISNCGCSLRIGINLSFIILAAWSGSGGGSPATSSWANAASMSEARVQKPFATLPKSFTTQSSPSALAAARSWSTQLSIRASSAAVRAHSRILSHTSEVSWCKEAEPLCSRRPVRRTWRSRLPLAPGLLLPCASVGSLVVLLAPPCGLHLGARGPDGAA